MSISISCFFSIRVYSREECLFAIISTNKYRPKGERDGEPEEKLLTTIPARLRNLSFYLLLGEEEDSNLRVVFWKNDASPEIKYLTFTWNDLLSSSNLDFSTRIHTLPD